jgi:signal peptidase I
MRIVAVVFNLIFVPGVGHVALGRWQRGLPWLAVAFLLPILALVNVWACLAAMVVGRIGAAVDAALIERRDHAVPLRALAIYGGGLVASILIMSAYKALVVEAFKLPSVAMVPTLEIGDHVFANKLAYRFGDPERGDLAVFQSQCEPEKDFIKRIVGLPGDSVEVRCDVLYVNGKAAPSTGLKEECAYWDRDDENRWVRRECTTYVEELGDRKYEIVQSPDRRERDHLRKVAAGEQTYEELRGDQDFPDRDIRPQCPEYVKDRPPAVGRIEASRGDAKDACAPRSHYVVPDGYVFVLGDNRENSADSRFWGPVPLDHLKGKVTSIWWSSRPAEQGGIAWGRIGAVD